MTMEPHINAICVEAVFACRKQSTFLTLFKRAQTHGTLDFIMNSFAYNAQLFVHILHYGRLDFISENRQRVDGHLVEASHIITIGIVDVKRGFTPHHASLCFHHVIQDPLYIHHKKYHNDEENDGSHHSRQ